MGNSNRKKPKTEPSVPQVKAEKVHSSPEKPKQQASSLTTPTEKVFSVKKLEELFDKYKDDDGSIGPTGIEKFCADIGADPQDVVILVMAYHLDASEMGYFSKEEFIRGFEKLKCDDLDKIKAQLPKFKEELNDTTVFKNIYRFAFNFAKEDRDQKCLDLEMAQGMLSLLAAERYWHAKKFVEFLKEQESCKALNADQWASLLEFCKTIKNDFSNYDENGAWPCILDDYALWAQQGESQGQESS